MPELFTFGLNSRGTYSSQTGHDDVAMSLVNLPSAFESGSFYQLSGELFDIMDNGYKTMILSKMGETNTTQNDPFSSSGNTFYSKDAKGYSDFNSLM